MMKLLHYSTLCSQVLEILIMQLFSNGFTVALTMPRFRCSCSPKVIPSKIEATPTKANEESEVLRLTRPPPTILSSAEDHMLRLAEVPFAIQEKVLSYITPPPLFVSYGGFLFHFPELSKALDFHFILCSYTKEKLYYIILCQCNTIRRENGWNT